MSKTKQNHPRQPKFIKATKTTKAIKHPRSFKLSDTALDILTELSSARGIAKSAVIESLLREEWARNLVGLRDKLERYAEDALNPEKEVSRVKKAKDTLREERARVKPRIGGRK